MAFRKFLPGFALLSLFFLAGCIYSPPPPPLQRDYGRALSSVPAGGYRVQPGDTLYGISQRFGLVLRELIEANDLAPPYRLLAGQILRLPGPQEHVVVAGDTLYGISRQYGVDLSELVRRNEVAPPYVIQVGQRLQLPFASPGRGAPDASVAEIAKPRSGVEVQTLPPPPPPPPPATSTTTAKTETAAVATKADQAPTPAPTPAKTVVAAKVETAPPVQKAAIRPSPIPQPPPLSGSQFEWPLQGSIIAGFGPKGKGQHNDGINIEAAKGTPIRAAQSGIVAYAGNELRGFGNLLLIKHADGWMTAYAHLDAFKVKRGEKVQRGQAIGAVGQTGNVSAPQLHFEIRKGNRAVDPLKHLGQAQALLISPAVVPAGQPDPE